MSTGRHARPQEPRTAPRPGVGAAAIVGLVIVAAAALGGLDPLMLTTILAIAGVLLGAAAWRMLSRQAAQLDAFERRRLSAAQVMATEAAAVDPVPLSDDVLLQLAATTRELRAEIESWRAETDRLRAEVASLRDSLADAEAAPIFDSLAPAAADRVIQLPLAAPADEPLDLPVNLPADLAVDLPGDLPLDLPLVAAPSAGERIIDLRVADRDHRWAAPVDLIPVETRRAG